MPKHLINIVKKELIEILRDPRLFIGMILVPILLFPIFGLIVHGFTEEAGKEALKPVDVAVLNLDEGSIAATVLNDTGFKYSIEQLNVSLIILNELNILDRDSAISFVSENSSINGLIIIPSNFSYCVENQLIAVVETYIPLRKVSSFMSTEEWRVNDVVSVFKEFVSYYIIYNLDPNANPVFVKNPVNQKVNTVYKENVLENVSPSSIIQMASMQLFMMPLAMMFIFTIAIQFAATSVSSEKEQKTLETLLTLPLNRATIVIGKLTGSILVSVVGTIGYIIGFQFYMSSFTTNIPTTQIDLGEIGLGLGAFEFTIIAISLFLSLLATLSITMIVASFAEDVRTAQSLAGFIILPTMLFVFIGIFATITGKITTLTTALLFIPFANPVMIPMYLLQKDYITIAISIIILAIQTIVFIELAAKFYASEKILSAKISLRKKKRKKEELE